MRKNYLWYNFWRYCIVKTALHLFYKKIEVVGKKNYPKGKPVIIAPIHQNALIDALMISAHVPGFIFALTRSGAFSTKFSNWFLRSLNLLPVYRVRDGLSSVTKNNAIFDICVNELGKNSSVLIFPEANHDLRRRVRPLSKGFTRIAFDAEVKNNWELDVHILPVGLNYTEHRRSRNRVQIMYGLPIPVKKYKELYESDERKAANQLKSDVSDEMKKTVMHVPNLDQYPAMQVLLTDLENDEYEYIDPKKVNKKVEKLSKQLTPEVIETGKQVVEISNQYDISIKTASGRKKPWVYLVLLFPLYAFSWLNNIIPYQPIRRIIDTKIKDHTFDATVKYMLGLFLFPLFWLVITMILWIIGVPGEFIIGYFGLSIFTSILFKNSMLVFEEASVIKKLEALKSKHPEVYKTFVDGIHSLNEFRKKAI